MDFSFIFLQTPAVGTPIEAIDTHVSLVELLFKGGPIMIPIVLLSLLSVYLIVERVLYIRRAMIIPSNQMQTVKDHLRRGQSDMALATLKQHNNSFSRILRE